MSEANQFKGLPSRQDIYKFAAGCGLATRTMEPSERVYLFAEKLIGYAVKLRKEYEDGDTFMRQRDNAYAINRELTEKLASKNERIEELETMVKVFRGCVETGHLPAQGSRCHKLIHELVGENQGSEKA